MQLKNKLLFALAFATTSLNFEFEAKSGPPAFTAIKISLPSLDNQIKASDKIFSMISFVKNICQKIEEEILALKKLKDSVVSEVVTGKIDVRNVAIPEYEYTPEEGSVDVADGEELEEEEDDNV